jgi:hypothetical protein
MKYEVLPFSAENLAYALKGSITEAAIKLKDQYKYFVNYLGPSGIAAAAIVIELEYVSKAYLSDYSNYYATCFKDYPRICKRLHFFSELVNAEKFKAEILDKKSSYLNDVYLGHIVVRLLPGSIIGATLLKTYPNAADRKRFYHAIRKYDVNLFGKKLTIESLAYQEQDTVVSACASMAIWSAFHKTSKLFQTTMPSASEITKMAGNFFLNSGRTFPNTGLDIPQIGKAIESVGLVSELRILDSPDQQFAKRFVYAYNKSGIPVLLFIDVKGNGYHLITVVGYSEKDEEPELTEEITLKADRITTFYAHDDQVGPFARIFLTNSTALETAWKDSDGNNIQGTIYAIFVPVYPKIRISYDEVFKKIRLIDIVLFRLDVFRYELEWDIYLVESNKYKNWILESDYPNELKENISFKNYPRYVWTAKAKIKGMLIFDFIFDSTDISRGYFCIDFHLYDPDAKEILRKVFIDRKYAIFDDDSKIRLGEDIFKIIEETLKP